MASYARLQCSVLTHLQSAAAAAAALCVVGVKLWAFDWALLLQALLQPPTHRRQTSHTAARSDCRLAWAVPCWVSAFCCWVLCQLQLQQPAYAAALGALQQHIAAHSSNNHSHHRTLSVSGLTCWACVARCGVSAWQQAPIPKHRI
jgi:hypothetical protein